LDAKDIAFLAPFADRGALGLFVGIAAGMVTTTLMHSSSAVTAIVLTMSYNGLLTWPLAAATVLGSNIGSTIDSVLAAIGSKANAKRAALVHVLFNVTGTGIAAVLFGPLLALIELIVPGPLSRATITTHIAMLHTVFNVLSTVIFLPFVNQIARLTERIIRDDAAEDAGPLQYHLAFADSEKLTGAVRLVRAEKEIADMAGVADMMFRRLRSGLKTPNEVFVEEYAPALEREENYVDQMQEEISRFLLHCQEMPLAEKDHANLPILMAVVNELEALTDDCYSAGMLLKRSIEKQMAFLPEDMERLVPYADLVQQALDFARAHINHQLSVEQFAWAEELETHVDDFRKDLKRLARKRIEAGADVKAELLYIDIVRNIEKIGDKAFGVSGALVQLKA
jgi:phosphate:Na+ symporter